MPETYRYKVRDNRGKLVSGTLVADSEALVLKRLREQGMTPVEVGREKKGLNLQINIGSKKIKLKELAVASRQFATMVNSGLPILRALTILSEQTANPEFTKVLMRVRLDVEQGKSLSGAMAGQPKAFNDLYVSMVRAGETGGQLDNVLLRLASMLEADVRLRSQIKSAMAYPVAVVGLVTLIMTAMLVFVVPQFKSIYSSLGGTLPLPTRALLGVSDALKAYWWLVILVIVGLRFALKRYKKTPKGREMVDGFKLKIPIFGKLFQKVALSRFSSTLAMLLRAGVPILHALEIVSDTVNNRIIAKAVSDVQASVREGEPIARPLAKYPIFPSMVVQMIAIGEETGQIDSMLEKVAQFYDQEVEATVDALTSLIEPLLIAVIGVCVGAAIISLYLPMFKIITLVE
jgi:type IV pilus assembly protein PilC